MSEEALVYSRDELRSAFVSPIRSAMLIDDKFPTYSELLKKEVMTRPGDWTEVTELILQCKERGLLCDVENRYQNVIKALPRIETSDLLILDFHLVPNDDRDGGPALNILAKLANSPHANLVVVYTAAEDLEEVKLDIAASFVRIPAAHSYTDEYLQFTASETPELERADIEGYLRYGTPGITRVSAKKVAAQLKELSLFADPKVIISQAIEDYLRNRLPAPLSFPDDKSRLSHPVSFSSSGSERVWIAHKNVFVAVVKKAQQRNVFEELELALTEWNPSPLHLLLVQARNFLETRGFLSDWNALADSVRQSAFVYHYLAGDGATPEQRLKQLFRNIFGRVFDEIADYIAAKGNSSLSNYAKQATGKDGENENDLEARRLRLAKDATRSTTEHTAADVLHELNNYLSSVPFVGSNLRTGTVFKKLTGETESFWVCVTADCSLVPRQPSDKCSWEAEIYPHIPIVALRLVPETGKQLEKELQTATRGRCLFVNSGEKRLALRIASEEARQPRPEVFVLSPPASIDNETARFSAMRITNEMMTDGKERTLVLEQSVFEVVAQLRPSYADRLLSETASYTTRIGVDFVNLK